MSRARVIVVLAATIAAVVLVSATAQARPRLDPPKRVMIVVIDQFLPEYVDRFDMKNVRAVMDDGVNFRRALVGHMAAETVITHNVLTSGLFPKHMGWSNEVYRDVDDVLGAGAGAYHVTSSLGCGDFETLLTAQGYPKLDDYLGGKFISVGQKPTAVCPAGHPAGPEDIIVHIGSRNRDCDARGSLNWRSPDGVNVPDYISAPDCGRFYVDATSSTTYGTGTTSPAWMYPLDGNRFAVGTDEDHLGGDVWTAGAAIELMENERDWKGMMVSFGSVDKMGHMWGTDDEGPSGVGDDVYEQAHLPYAVRTADEQVGRVLAELDAQGIRDETLVVLTTDHAGQTADRYHGEDGAGRGNFNWYYGEDSNETYLDPQPALAPLIATGNVGFNYQDGHIATWAKDTLAGRAAQDRSRDAPAAGRDRLLRARRRPLPPCRTARPHEPARVHLVAAPRPGADRHDGGAVRPRRGRAAARRRLLRRQGRPRRAPAQDPARSRWCSPGRGSSRSSATSACARSTSCRPCSS